MLYDDLVINDIDEKDDLSIEHSELEVELSQVASKIKGMLLLELMLPLMSQELGFQSWTSRHLMGTSFIGNNFGNNSPFLYMIEQISRMLRKLFICSMHSKMKEFNGRSLSLWR